MICGVMRKTLFLESPASDHKKLCSIVKYSKGFRQCRHEMNFLAYQGEQAFYAGSVL
ncbi:hypothetical protein KL86DES1_20067 [uncultured Desulfovibrio sp.]|uniref:Uncharacterized protein n=1 Tax=uncultured Desulfovibrio sp. TaxID=167968 RepID=A0A212L205_9BACT|nr:hypothetical protein KL86DES1_20067 [uncultured Desulfovibrio sp.]